MKRHAISRVLAVLLCALSMQVARTARGDDDEDARQREQLVHAIENELDQMSRALYGVAGASSEDGVSSAMEHARALKDDVDRLKSVKGSDSAANHIVDYYPGYVDGFNDAAKGLHKLKRTQLGQEDRELWKVCAEGDKNLREAVKPFLEPPDPDGLEKIPDLAERGKSNIHDAYARELSRASETRSAFDDARRFSVSDNGWSDVSSRLRDGADALWSKYDARARETTERCADLDKGKDAPFIVESLGKLKGAHAGSKQVLEDILKDWGAWKQLRRELAATYVVNADKIRFAMCDGDEENILSRVEDAEKSAQGNLKSGYETLDKELDQLIERAGKLENDKSVGKDARMWRGVMRGARTKLAKVLQDGGLLQGVANAKVRARIEIGIKKHKDYQGSSSNCTDDEVQVSSGRIDCVKVDSGWCHIIEIKPNNDKAVSKGWDQVKRYQGDVLDSWRDKDRSRLPEVFRTCISSDSAQELQLKTDVVTYDFCPVPDEDIDAMLAEQARQAGSTADE